MMKSIKQSAAVTQYCTYTFHLWQIRDHGGCLFLTSVSLYKMSQSVSCLTVMKLIRQWQ